MQELTVGLNDRSYSIMIGPGLLGKFTNTTHTPFAKKLAIVTNDKVAPLYLETAISALQATGAQISSLVLPDGEEYKKWETLNKIYDHLLTTRCDRAAMIIALGGGVIGDLAGFAAATYQRGIPFVQIPTTLLAQVDSSVGGKTGINHPLGKNMIGAFWQPKLVIADTDTLKTLPDRELSAGLAEVIKYGLIRDLPFLEWLEANMPRLMQRDSEALAYAIKRSCENKAEVVAGDELETAKEGGRALLNLGHTFGHAIETGAGYGVWLHGEAVAAGMMMATELSHRLGWLTENDVERVRSLLVSANLPVKGAGLGADRYLDLMSHDKKVLEGRLRLILLKRLGEAVTWANAPASEIVATITACCE